MDEKNVEISRRARAEVEARTADAVAELAAVRAELEHRGDGAARPGDLYVTAETAEQPLEWLVVDSDPARPARLWVVPADTQPWIGSADLSVADHQPGGALVLRCDHGVEIDATLLDAEMRTGKVDNETLDRVRIKRRQLAGEPAPDVRTSTEQVETDADPEYALWIEEVVAPARAALESAGSSPLRLVSGATDKPATGSQVTTPASRRGWMGSEGTGWLRLAQAAIVPLAVGLVWLLMGSPGWHDDPEIATLTLTMSTRAGGEAILTPAPKSKTIELRVDLGEDDNYRSFKAILSTLAGTEVWRAEDLPPTTTEGVNEVVLRLPSELLPAGDYELALEGVKADGAVSEVGFYSFEIDRLP